MEEISRGCASTRRDHERQQLARAAIRCQVRHRRAEARVSGAAGGGASSSAASRSRSRKRLRRGGAEDHRARPTARLVHQRHQELDHQRPDADVCILHTMTAPEKGTRASPRSSCRRHDQGRAHAASRREARHPRLAVVPDLPRRRAAARSALAARRRGRRLQGRDVRRSTAAASASPRRRSASRAPPRGRPRVRQGAQGLRQADRASTRRSSSCSPTWRPSSTPRAC